MRSVCVCTLFALYRLIPMSSIYQFGIMMSRGDGSIFSENFKLSRDSEEFTEVANLLRRYSYHRSVTSRFRNDIPSKNDGSVRSLYVVTIGLISGENVRVVNMNSQTPFIAIDGRVYRIGVWGSSRIEGLIKGVVDVLK